MINEGKVDLCTILQVESNNKHDFSNKTFADLPFKSSPNFNKYFKTKITQLGLAILKF